MIQGRRPASAACGGFPEAKILGEEPLASRCVKFSILEVTCYQLRRETACVLDDFGNIPVAQLYLEQIVKEGIYIATLLPEAPASSLSILSKRINKSVTCPPAYI